MNRTWTLKTLMVAATVALVLVITPMAMAGEYHETTSLVCYECHVMHYSQSHEYDGGAGTGEPDGTPPQAAMLSGPNEKLLRQQGANTCLSCHDGQTDIPDVRGADANATPTSVRQAGALTTAASPYEDYKGHTLELSAPPTSIVPPGHGGSAASVDTDDGLQCYDCHDPHGNSFYRNLDETGTEPVVGVDYLIDTTGSVVAPVAAGEDVFIEIGAALDSVGANGSRIGQGYYDTSKISFNESAQDDSPYGDLCAKCHGLFHTTTNTNSASPFKRHPVEGGGVGVVDFTTEILGRYTTTGNSVQAMAVGNSVSNSTFATATPSCMSCHKAHGNQRPFGLIYMTKSGAVTEEGTAAGVYQDLCQQCHVQGVAP